MKLEPIFKDLNNAETIIEHIKELKKPEDVVPHAEVLNKLLDQVERVDFEAAAFPHIAELRQQLEAATALSMKLANSDKRNSPEAQKASEEMQRLNKEVDKLKLQTKHYRILSVKSILKLAEQQRWGLCKNDDFIYLYNGTYWQQIDKEEFQKFLGEASEKMGVKWDFAEDYRFREELFKQFLATAYLPTPETDKSRVLVNLQNGTFEITNGKVKLRTFNRADFLTYQLGFDYNPEATAPMFQAYLDKVLPDVESQKVLAEYLGYIFIKHGSTLKLEAALILYGTGANGKSVFFEIVNAMLGNENVSSYSLQELTDHSGYYRAMIANKLVNYASEINGKLEVDTFKKMVSGEPVAARLPYGKPMQIKQYAKFIFNCNELPKDVEHSNAYFRRWLIIPFDVTIPKAEQDSELHTKIIDKELSGVFNWVLGGLGRLLEQRKFSKSEAVQRAIEQYKLNSDSVQQFTVEENYKPSIEHKVPLKEMYKMYKYFCEENNFRACSLITFGNRLRAIGYETERLSYGNAVFAEKNNN